MEVYQRNVVLSIDESDDSFTLKHLIKNGADIVTTFSNRSTAYAKHPELFGPPWLRVARELSFRPEFHSKDAEVLEGLPVNRIREMLRVPRKQLLQQHEMAGSSERGDRGESDSTESSSSGSGCDCDSGSGSVVRELILRVFFPDELQPEELFGRAVSLQKMVVLETGMREALERHNRVLVKRLEDQEDAGGGEEEGECRPVSVSVLSPNKDSDDETRTEVDGVGEDEEEEVSEVSELRERLKVEKQRRRIVMEENESLRKQRERLDDRLVLEKGTVHKIQHDFDQHKTQTEIYMSSMNQRMRQFRALKSHHEQLAEEKNKIAYDLMDWKTRVTAKQADLDQMKEKSVLQQRFIDSLKAKLSTVREEEQAVVQRRQSRLRKKAAARFERERGEYQDEIAALSTEVERLRRRVNVRKAEVAASLSGESVEKRISDAVEDEKLKWESEVRSLSTKHAEEVSELRQQTERQTLKWRAKLRKAQSKHLQATSELRRELKTVRDELGSLQLNIRELELTRKAEIAAAVEESRRQWMREVDGHAAKILALKQAFIDSLTDVQKRFQS